METFQSNSIIQFIGTTSIYLGLALFLLITFSQTAVDKLVNYESNFDYFKNHFNGTILENSLKFVFPILIFQEFVTAVFALAAFISLFFGIVDFLLFDLILALITFISLYFGQRISKHFEEASNLLVYIILCIISIYILIH